MTIKQIIKEEITHSKIDGELIEEGFKDWVIAGLMTLSSMSGIQAQSVKEITPKHIKAAEMVQDRLESGDEDVLKYFDEARIELNSKNLETLKNTKIKKGGEIDSTTAKSKSELRSKLNQGYTVTEVNIFSDTIYPKNISVDLTVQDTIPFGYKSDNMFKSGGFELKSEIIQDLQTAINEINESGTKIIGVQIESSTDTEPIKMGNEKLSQLRAQSVQGVLEQLGVDVGVEINTLPNQGPNLFSKNMGVNERNQVRQETQQYRYVKISFMVVIDVVIPTDGQQNMDILVKKHVTYKLVKLKNVSKSHGNYKFKMSKPKPKIKGCKAMSKRPKGDNKMLKCTSF